MPTGWWYTVRDSRGKVIVEDEYDTAEEAKEAGCYYKQLLNCSSVEVKDDQGNEVFKDTVLEVRA